MMPVSYLTGFIASFYSFNQFFANEKAAFLGSQKMFYPIVVDAIIITPITIFLFGEA